jgi:hypothetical protein
MQVEASQTRARADADVASLNLVNPVNTTQRTSLGDSETLAQGHVHEDGENVQGLTAWATQ